MSVYRPFPSRRACIGVVLSTLPLLVLATAAAAHVGAGLDDHALWAEWNFDPLIWGLSGFFAWVFLRGVGRRPVHPGRVIAYLLGLLVVLVALVSPIDYMAEHLFWVHQVQHMALHVIGPLAILAAAPQGVIFSGMPRGLRYATIRPILGSRGMRRLGTWISHPAAATVLFILSLYVWQIPRLHDAALLNSALHYFMHVTMLATGILFFWVVLDHRDPPKAAKHGTRFLMLIASVLSQIVLGAIITMKSTQLYPAYDVTGRLFGMTAIADETAGGFLIWSPGCMMLIITMLLVINRWNGTEVRQAARHGAAAARSNSAAWLVPETAEELRLMVTPKNRRLGAGLGLIATTMFLLVIGLVVTIRTAG